MVRASGRLLYKYVLQGEKIKHKNNDRTPQICQIIIKIVTLKIILPIFLKVIWQNFDNYLAILHSQ